jgi:uncharacterized protein YcbK (DUF882 family)
MVPPRLLRALAAALVLGAGALGALPARADAVHVVGRGQTLFYIAKVYRTTPDAIRAANGLREGQLIHPGLSLTIPGVTRKAKAVEAKSPPATKDKAKPKDKDKSGAKGKGKEKEPEKEAAGGKTKGGKNAKNAKDAKAPAAAGSYAARPKKAGFVTMLRGTEKLEVQLLARGKLNRAALSGLTKILRFVPSDSKKAVDPRLAYLVGLVSDHFGGKKLHVVSGYRPFSKSQYTPHSNHNLGRAMDFLVEGVPNTVVRDYCKTLRDAGVGYYPNSTFVHLDVRTGKAYWIDYSGPGEAPKYDAHTKGKVDESARDVESSTEGGSAATQDDAKQPVDTKVVPSGTPAPKPVQPKGQGLRTPTPPKPGSPTLPVGVSSDPYP